MGRMGRELTQAVDALYDVFARYPRPASFVGCACCWDGPGATPLPDTAERRGAVLVAAPGGHRPLRELEAHELVHVAAEVPPTAGTFDVLKHYLPRLIEIATHEGFDWLDLETIVGHLAYDDQGGGAVPWLTWPQDEQEAIRGFLHALWTDSLGVDDDDAGHGVVTALNAAISIEPSIGWYLAEWLRFRTPAWAINLERWLQLELTALRKNGRATPDELVQWVRSDDTLDAVRRAAERARTPAEADALAECYLRWLPSCRP